MRSLRSQRGRILRLPCSRQCLQIHAKLGIQLATRIRVTRRHRHSRVSPRLGSAFASTARPGSAFCTCARGVVDDLALYHQSAATPTYRRVIDVAGALGGAAGTGVPPTFGTSPPQQRQGFVVAFPGPRLQGADQDAPGPFGLPSAKRSLAFHTS